MADKITAEKQLIRQKQHIIDTAAGRKKAELVLKNADYVNVFSREILHGDIAVCEDVIAGIGSYEGEKELDMRDSMVLPGFYDGHMHLESTLVEPAEFAEAAALHGTAGIMADPHEIANVLGSAGISYMLEATENLPVDVYFMLPSCVPATPTDESGAVLHAAELETFYADKRVLGLAEMMDFPGVVSAREDIMEKEVSAQHNRGIIDGHAPDLKDKDLNAYIASGVYSDHECYNLQDAVNKLRLGQWIMIREGTAARNLEALMPLICEPYIDRILFCTDDRHPNDLLAEGHIDNIVRKAIKAGAEPALAVQVASVNAARYFGLRGRGAIAPGYAADMLIIDNFEDFNVQTVIKNGRIIAEGGRLIGFAKPHISEQAGIAVHDTFHLHALKPEDFALRRQAGLIGMVKNEIITTDGGFASGYDIEKDILKIAVVERHKNTGHIGIGYLHGYGLKKGAVATSVAHDSHNIIVVGTNDVDMAFAAQSIADMKGGIAVIENGKITASVPLPIAGLMSEMPLKETSAALEKAKKAAYAAGVSADIDPFMTLSFMSLTVIPSLRITTEGVFDVRSQEYLK